MNIRSTDTLSLVTSAAVATDVYVSYGEAAMGTQSSPIKPKSKNTAITTATTTTILGGANESPDYAWNSRTVQFLSIRNKGASSQTVTLRHSDGTTTVELRKIILAAGAEIQYAAGLGWATVATSTSPSGSTLITATADTVNAAADTLASVAGLTFAVEAGDTYWFRAVCLYTADATTSGSRWTINGPAITALAYRSNYSLTTTTETLNAGLGAHQLPAAASASSGATTGNVAIVEGFFTPSAAGNLVVQFAAEAGTITAKAGSKLEVMKMIDA